MKKEEIKKIAKIIIKYLRGCGILESLDIKGKGEKGFRQFTFKKSSDWPELVAEDLTNEILDAGYVHKSQITIAEGEVIDMLNNMQHCKEITLQSFQEVRKIAKALKKANIIKIGEAKK